MGGIWNSNWFPKTDSVAVKKERNVCQIVNVDVPAKPQTDTEKKVWNPGKYSGVTKTEGKVEYESDSCAHSYWRALNSVDVFCNIIRNIRNPRRPENSETVAWCWEYLEEYLCVYIQRKSFSYSEIIRKFHQAGSFSMGHVHSVFWKL